jgi:hypothetical protein
VPYEVKFIEDDDLPPAVDWAIVTNGRTNRFFVKRSRLSPGLLAEAWAAWAERRQEGRYSIASRSPAATNA